MKRRGVFVLELSKEDWQILFKHLDEEIIIDGKMWFPTGEKLTKNLISVENIKEYEDVFE